MWCHQNKFYHITSLYQISIFIIWIFFLVVFCKIKRIPVKYRTGSTSHIIVVIIFVHLMPSQCVSLIFSTGRSLFIIHISIFFYRLIPRLSWGFLYKINARQLTVGRNCYDIILWFFLSNNFKYIIRLSYLKANFDNEF